MIDPNLRFLPGCTVGVLGGGQLGRMLAMEARRLGYRVYVFSDHKGSPAGQLADREVVGSYSDIELAVEFAQAVDVVTFEFENVPFEVAGVLRQHTCVRPDPLLLKVSQNRNREKLFAQDANVPTTKFKHVLNLQDLSVAGDEIGYPCVLKTATEGYDGKGQRVIKSADELLPAYESLGFAECVLEAWVDYKRELSVIVAGSAQGDICCFDPIENTHHDHVLDVSSTVLLGDNRLKEKASKIAEDLAKSFELVGVMCVELFETMTGELLFNEIAPRTHNSGHLTIEAARTSQFEQQLRAVCGLPLGNVEFRSHAAMANILGDLWTYNQDGTVATVPSWSVVFGASDSFLHLYGKAEPRRKRKMGHITVLDTNAAAAIDKVTLLRSSLKN